MAIAYLSRDLRHDRLVALKLLDPEPAALLGIERFLTEIRVMATLAFGAYRTFQGPVDRVERVTGLSFGRLGAHDPLRNRSARRRGKGGSGSSKKQNPWLGSLLARRPLRAICEIRLQLLSV
jgi:hypothetical protein